MVASAVFHQNGKGARSTDAILVYGVVNDPATAPDHTGSIAALYYKLIVRATAMCLLAHTFLYDFAAECSFLSF